MELITTVLGQMFGKSLQSMLGSLASIHEDQVALQDSIGAVKDGLSSFKQSFDSLRDNCDMSQATQCKHVNMFEFEAIQEFPPMVDAADPRVSALVKKLKFYRSAQDFNRNNESQCRLHSIDPFFDQVASALKCELIKPDDLHNSLIVRLGRVEFRGKADLLVGHADVLPLLPIEIKPMAGPYRLKGTGFDNEDFKHKTQIALQCAAFQAQCGDSATEYSCLLTNLLVLYVVQIKSYNATTISTRIFQVVEAENLFVRAVLRAADDNRSLTQDLKKFAVGPWICEAANAFDCHRKDPAVSGIPQVPQGSGVLEDNLVAGQGGGDNSCLSATKMQTNFERLLPTRNQQKSDIRPNFTRAWLRLSAREHLNDLSSISNVESNACLWE